MINIQLHITKLDLLKKYMSYFVDMKAFQLQYPNDWKFIMTFQEWFDCNLNILIKKNVIKEAQEVADKYGFPLQVNITDAKNLDFIK